MRDDNEKVPAELKRMVLMVLRDADHPDHRKTVLKHALNTRLTIAKRLDYHDTAEQARVAFELWLEIERQMEWRIEEIRRDTRRAFSNRLAKQGDEFLARAIRNGDYRAIVLEFPKRGVE